MRSWQRLPFELNLPSLAGMFLCRTSLQTRQPFPSSTPTYQSTVSSGLSSGTQPRGQRLQLLTSHLRYSLHSPMSLVLWEAQFGDFANTAQVLPWNKTLSFLTRVIRSLSISSSRQESRSGCVRCAAALDRGSAELAITQSGLVMLLPHGYEGQVQSDAPSVLALTVESARGQSIPRQGLNAFCK